jgi:hypothetical protein
MMSWPGGFGSQLRLDGRARDLLTGADGDTRVLAEDACRVGLGVDRSIAEIAVFPDRRGMERLVGVRGGTQIRAALAEVSPLDPQRGSPLCLLLDDVPGSGLISAFAWSRWDDSWMEKAAEQAAKSSAGRPRRPMVGTCAGFRPGSSALGEDGASHPERRQNVTGVPPLADPADPLGWHELPPHPSVAMRRARRIDVWRENGTIAVDAMFRDSCWQPDGLEVAVHEYAIGATIDEASGVLASVAATPRVLPFAECPAAAPNASWMVGVRAEALRGEVLERLRSVDCCTHLNDALRALTEVPILASLLGATA